MTFIRLENFGVCTHAKCMTEGPRCNINFCEIHCKKFHEYWAGHRMADGHITVLTKSQPALPYVPPEPPKPKEPELGGATELSEDVTDVFIPMGDTSRASCAKTQFPVKYVK
jgi:hypothetical protein